MTGIYTKNSLSLSFLWPFSEISLLYTFRFPWEYFNFKFFSIYLLPSHCYFALCSPHSDIYKTNLQNWCKWLASIIASPAFRAMCAATTNVSLIGTINIIIMQICTNDDNAALAVVELFELNLVT